MNFRKFHLLHDRLMVLLSQREEIFLTQRSLFDNLTLQVMQCRYPDLDCSENETQLAINNTISELKNLLNPGDVEQLYQQTLQIFSNNE